MDDHSCKYAEDWKRLKDTPDPTENVRFLIQAESKRQDDLRDAEAKRQDNLREAETVRINEQTAMRETYSEKLAIAEAKRIDAIRAIDVNAVSVANERAIQQASVLATQVTTSADTLRASANTTNTTNDGRFAKLEQSSYEGLGRSGLSTSLLMTIAAVVAGLVVFLVEAAVKR